MSCDTGTLQEFLAGNPAHLVATFVRPADVDEPVAGTTAVVEVLELDGTRTPVPGADVDVATDDDTGIVTVTADWPIPADHPDGRIVFCTTIAAVLTGYREDAVMVVAQS